MRRWLEKPDIRKEKKKKPEEEWKGIKAMKRKIERRAWKYAKEGNCEL